MSRTSNTSAAIAPVPAAKNRAPTPSPLEADGTPWLVQLREDMVIDVNYFCRLTTTILAGAGACG